MCNPFKKRSHHDRIDLQKKRGMIPLEDKYGTIQDNGYVSSTLKTVKLGQLTNYGWIGEELLHWKEPQPFPYNATAYTVTHAYKIHVGDLHKLPP